MINDDIKNAVDVVQRPKEIMIELNQYLKKI